MSEPIAITQASIPKEQPANAFHPELVEGDPADELTSVLDCYKEVFDLFERFCTSKYFYIQESRSQLFESILLAQILEHAKLLRALVEGPQKLYAPLAAVFRGFFESGLKLLWLLLDYPKVERHQKLEVDSILEEENFKKGLFDIGFLSACQLQTQQEELAERLQKINLNTRFKNVKDLKKSIKIDLKMSNIVSNIAPHFRESKKDLYQIYRLYSGLLHSRFDALGREYILNGSIVVYSHRPERYIEVYSLATEILEILLVCLKKPVASVLSPMPVQNPSTSSTGAGAV